METRTVTETGDSHLFRREKDESPLFRLESPGVLIRRLLLSFSDRPAAPAPSSFVGKLSTASERQPAGRGLFLVRPSAGRRRGGRARPVSFRRLSSVLVFVEIGELAT